VSVAASATDFAPGLERLFERLPPEADRRIAASDVEGEVPSWLRGTYYLNGPARFSRGDVAYRHWLDGDGMVCALSFGDDGARLVNRFVRSHKWVAEEEAGRALYRTFGTAFAGDRLLRGIALASPVNVSVYPWAGKLLAFGEQGLPWELDPETLETRGEHTFDGRLNAISPFSAHPHIDPVSGEMVNFGVSFAARRPMLHLYRFAPSGELVLRRRHALDAPRSVHDFALSERYAVFYLSPYVFDMEAFMAEGATLIDGLAWRPELGSRIRVFDRETGDEVADLAIGSKYCLHLVNAFEPPPPGRGQPIPGGRLVLDVIELEEPVYPDYHPLSELFHDVEPGQPVRRILDLDRGEVISEEKLPFRQACDFPNIGADRTGREYEDFWLLGISATGREGRKFFDRLVHCRWGNAPRAYDSPAGRYLGGEPVCVHHPSDRERVAVICQEFDSDADRGCFLVFDGLDVEAGPLARIPAASPLPLLFHAAFEPAPSFATDG